MYPSERIRSFPFRPAPQPGGLTDYIEYSGCNVLLIEAVKKLYEVPNKPENPIEWLRLYFKYLAEDVEAEAAAAAAAAADDDEDEDSNNETESTKLVSTEASSMVSDFTHDLSEVEFALKRELTQIELELISCFEEEAQNQAVIENLEKDVKNVTLDSTKSQYHDDFRRYLDHGDDYHYRIKPDPLYQPSKTDLLLDGEEVGGQGGRQKSLTNVLVKDGGGRGGAIGKEKSLKPNDSFVELLSFDPNQWMDGFTSARQSRSIWRLPDEHQNVYDDYPLLYFSERQWKLSGVGDGEEEGEGNEDETEMDEQEEEEEDETLSELESLVGGGNDSSDKAGGKESLVKKLIREETEYDGGSEGGESDQSKTRTKTQQSLYTPRSAHDKKHNKTKSQKSHHVNKGTA